jgi:hypothetical protein
MMNPTGPGTLGRLPARARAGLLAARAGHAPRRRACRATSTAATPAHDRPADPHHPDRRRQARRNTRRPAPWSSTSPAACHATSCARCATAAPRSSTQPTSTPLATISLAPKPSWCSPPAAAPSAQVTDGVAITGDDAHARLVLTPVQHDDLTAAICLLDSAARFGQSVSVPRPRWRVQAHWRVGGGRTLVQPVLRPAVSGKHGEPHASCRSRCRISSTSSSPSIPSTAPSRTPRKRSASTPLRTPHDRFSTCSTDRMTQRSVGSHATS